MGGRWAWIADLDDRSRLLQWAGGWCPTSGLKGSNKSQALNFFLFFGFSSRGLINK